MQPFYLKSMGPERRSRERIDWFCVAAVTGLFDALSKGPAHHRFGVEAGGVKHRQRGAVGVERCLQREAVALFVELVGLRGVDQAEDLADVVVAQRHRCRG